LKFASFRCHRQERAERAPASKLIGWDIDIKSEEEKAPGKLKEQDDRLTAPVKL